jgi:hypothetical protein
MRIPLILSCALLSTFATAQTTKEGYSLSWNNTLTVVPDTLVNGKFKLPAYTVTIFEADASSVLDLWKNDVKASSKEVSGSKPVKAIGTVQPNVAEGPVMVLATSSADKRAGIGRLTLAYASNDSTPVENQKAAQSAVEQLAVKYNKATVQAQIATKEKQLEKAVDKVASAQADASKLDQKAGKVNSDLKKVKAKQGKLQADHAKMSGEIAGLEKKFQLTNNPKDLQKLTKVRTKLAKSEGDLAKLMQSEAKIQGNLNKLQGNMPDAAKAQQEKTETKEQLQQEIQSLKRKMDNIR